MRSPSRIWNPNDIPVMFSEHIEPQPLPSPVRRRQNRADLLDESASTRIKRMVTAFKTHIFSQNWLDLVRVADLIVRDRAVRVSGLPDPEHALRAPNGFCALADDLSPGLVMDVYARGIFLDSGLTEASFWAPADRDVVDLEHFGPKRLHPAYLFSFDSNFDIVLARSNEARVLRQSARLLNAFAELADTGFAHALEMRDGSGALIAGAFGIATGRVFVVQGCFARSEAERDILLDGLLTLLAQRTFVLADLTPLRHISHPAAELIARVQFSAIVCDNLAGLRVGRWSQDAADDLTLAKAAA